MSYIQSFEGENPHGVTEEMSKIYVDEQAILRLQSCVPNAGEFTLQFCIKASDELTVHLESSGLDKSIVVNQAWKKCVFTFSSSEMSSISFQLPVGIYYFYHVKLECGRVPTDWTPAPESNVRLMSSDTQVESPLYKLSDLYTDKLYCDNGLWYIERNTETIVVNGSEDWKKITSDTYTLYLPLHGSANRVVPAISDYFTYDRTLSSVNTFRVTNSSSGTAITVKTDVDDFAAWLSTNNVRFTLPAAESYTVRLANYLQTSLNSVMVGDSLQVSIDGDATMRGAVLVKPIVFGEVNGDMQATINNSSDDEIGFIYQIHCKDVVVNPVIHHAESNQHIKINGSFKLDDIITIDTRQGRKSVTKTYRGIDTNIINQIDNTSKWLQLQSGYNHLIQSADSGADNMDSVIIYTNEYEGV